MSDSTGETGVSAAKRMLTDALAYVSNYEYAESTLDAYLMLARAINLAEHSAELLGEAKWYLRREVATSTINTTKENDG